jgi:hypothetical protein
LATPPDPPQNPDLFDLGQEPAVDLRKVENLLNGEAGARENVPVGINFRGDAPVCRR